MIGGSGLAGTIVLPHLTGCCHLAGLDHLHDLVNSFSSGGPRVRIERYGPNQPVDASIGLAAYRVAQESLTDVARHAGAVEVQWAAVPGSSVCENASNYSAGHYAQGPPRTTASKCARSSRRVLTTYHLDEYVDDALLAGAGGFLLKDTPIARLQDAIRTVAFGNAALSPR